ncbi:MAG: sensor domain-containing diguanylate cyclase [Candidatus Aminicenantes bacterium]|nr:sensor domain-containing diguanylate cyclase [Candidatus Aminicenantes bacterium]
MDGKNPVKETKQEIKVRELVSERQQIEVRLRESEKKYRDLLMHLPVGVYRTTPEGEIIEANNNLVHLLSFADQEDIKSINVRDLYVDSEDRKRHQEKLATSLTEFSDFRLRRKDGKIIWGRDYPRAVKDSEGQVIYYDGILVDITDQRESENKLKIALVELERANMERQKMIKRLENLSLLDDLTGLYNRRGFYVAAKSEMIKSHQDGNRLFLLYLDLDHLKKINDTWGHQTGDQALVRFVEILKSTFRKSDVMGRMGGDEFAVIAIESMPDLPELLLDRVNKNMISLNETKKYSFTLALSSGTARYNPADPITIDDLLKKADAEMYKTKNAKKEY